MEEDDESFRSAIIRKSRKRFKFFFNTIFSQSIELIEGRFIPGEHIDTWCDRIQDSNETATLSARNHAKSMTIYGFLAWLLFNVEIFFTERFPEVLYLSYMDKLAGVHVRNLKRLVEINPYFADFQNLSTAETILKMRKGEKTFTVTPGGIMAFKRGRHTIGTICDDILQDPQAVKMDLSQIKKVSTTFFEQVASIKKKGGFNHVVGTAQDKEDLFFQLQKNKKYDWAMYKAITSFKNKTSLWPEQFSYNDLISIRDDEIGQKAFSKEYQCVPIRSAESYFDESNIDKLISDRYNIDINEYKTDNRVVGGYDIGKKAHPAHFSVHELFELEQTEEEKKKSTRIKYKMKQLISKHFVKVNYTEQVEYIDDVIKKLGMEIVLYDNTRGELEGLDELGKIPPEMKPFIFSFKSKNAMATHFDVMVGKKRIDFVNDDKQKNQILSVDNDLDAPSTAEGHGDAFWSNAMTCMVANKKQPGMRWI